MYISTCCFRYHKGTDFQANHNRSWLFSRPSEVVLDTTKVQIFKQITTLIDLIYSFGQLFQIPQRYRFSSKSQRTFSRSAFACVVLDTTKVQIFKQITTYFRRVSPVQQLFQIPQRYRFSSKSQHILYKRLPALCCFRYHKGTDFQANHNCLSSEVDLKLVVLDTTKVQIFKQITTSCC